MENKQKNDVAMSAGLEANSAFHTGMTRSTHYKIEALRDGKVIWEEEFDNLVVTEGLNDSLDKHFKGSTYTATWYVGLTGDTPSFAAGDTLATHGGWTEVSNYTGNRKALTLGTISGGSVDNSASKASYTIGAGGANVGGAFVCTVDTGTAGVLYGGGAFSQNRALLENDVLNVTVTLTAAAA